MFLSNVKKAMGCLLYHIYAFYYPSVYSDGWFIFVRHCSFSIKIKDLQWIAVHDLTDHLLLKGRHWIGNIFHSVVLFSKPLFIQF